MGNSGRAGDEEFALNLRMSRGAHGNFLYLLFVFYIYKTSVRSVACGYLDLWRKRERIAAAAYGENNSILPFLRERRRGTVSDGAACGWRSEELHLAVSPGDAERVGFCSKTVGIIPLQCRGFTKRGQRFPAYIQLCTVHAARETD